MNLEILLVFQLIQLALLLDAIMAKEPIIEFKEVSKLKDRDPNTIVLNKISFKIFEGEVTTIIGMSGSGKSLIAHLISGLRKPDAGLILFRGKPFNQMSRREWNDYLSKISYMFQKNALFDSLTVFENVALPLKYTTNFSNRQIRNKVLDHLDRTDLQDQTHLYPSQMSGGMQQRAALARALVTSPSIILFDEPTASQDPIRKNAVLGMVAEYQKHFGFTAILISHDIPDVFFISNRILVLHNKEIGFQGHPNHFESVDHPLRQEIIDSLESLGDELTGLYSRRHFKVRYQTDLSQRQPDASFVAAVFTLDNIDAIDEHLEHDAIQQIVRSLGSYINKHFGTVGGFTSRQTINEYATVLPFSDLDEANRILDDFTKDFQEHGIKGIEMHRGKEGSDESYIQISVLAGLAQGQPHIEIESLMEFARFNQKEAARFEVLVED